MQVFLISPRGFCAGVNRAITILNQVIEKYKHNIYCLHQIVHNENVVNDFIQKGVIFIDHINQVPNNGIVVFSAHGISLEVENLAKDRNLKTIDATCPLVKKIHHSGMKYENENKEIILIGHKNHAEIIGTSGRLKNKIAIIENKEDAKKFTPKDEKNLVYITQTTLSLDDCQDIINILKSRFPKINQDRSNICYATQNRQNAIKSIAEKLDLLIIFGSEKSSNSCRLRDLGENLDIETHLILSIEQLKKDYFNNKKSIGVTSGASSPEILTHAFEKYILSNFNDVKIENYEYVKESIEFKILNEI